MGHRLLLTPDSPRQLSPDPIPDAFFSPLRLAFAPAPHQECQKEFPGGPVVRSRPERTRAERPRRSRGGGKKVADTDDGNFDWCGLSSEQSVKLAK